MEYEICTGGLPYTNDTITRSSYIFWLVGRRCVVRDG